MPMNKASGAIRASDRAIRARSGRAISAANRGGSAEDIERREQHDRGDRATKCADALVGETPLERRRRMPLPSPANTRKPASTTPIA